ncbi:MAG: transglutaminase domain-containing protein [Bryobacterales bacterium]|nr:transglutaminase domain-containing protein [Bryobacterales bacterium]
MNKIFLLCFATALHAADRWYEIRIAGQPSGYQHSTMEALENGGTRSTEETVIVINRLGAKVEITMKAVSVENAAGDLVSVREETSQSQQTIVTEAELRGNKILLRSSAGSNSYDRSMPLRAPVCGPASFNRLIVERLKKAGDQASCRVYAPSIGSPFKSSRTLVGIEAHDGVQALRVKTELDGIPGMMTELLDTEGQTLESEREMPFGKMVVRSVSRETALQAAGGAELPAESFDRTLARSNVRFADAREIERMKLKLTHKNPELGWPAFTSAMQTVIERTPSSLILEVARPERKAATENIAEAPFLKPNQILQSDDPEVIRLAQSIGGDEPDRYKAARKLQDWVAANMSFNLGVALTPASEVVRNRQGTCMAYSVLLASMARALGIPSRLAGGYIYVAGIWGGHAWVEVLVDNQWLPLDAAGYRPGLADAARIQFGSYTAEDNLGRFVAAGSQMYGNIDIAVLEYTIGGKTVRVAEGERRYTVSGDEYRSEGLGISVRKPEGFTFSKLDATYPDNTILEIQNGPSKVTLALIEAVADPDGIVRKLTAEAGSQASSAKLDGRAATIVSAPGKTMLTSRSGQSLWTITAEGGDTAGLQNQVAGGWKWLFPR